MTLVRTDRRGGALLVELARADAGNALSTALVDELARAVATPGEGARALVLTGSGRHFCAGADLAELAAGTGASEEERVADAMRLGALYAALLRCPLLTIAAVHGAAFGGGAGLAACCDLVIAGPGARFQFSEARLGFVPALISTFLPRRIAPARLARLFLDPEPLGPEAALDGRARGRDRRRTGRVRHTTRHRARAQGRPERRGRDQAPAARTLAARPRRAPGRRRTLQRAPARAPRVPAGPGGVPRDEDVPGVARVASAGGGQRRSGNRAVEGVALDGNPLRLADQVLEVGAGPSPCRPRPRPPA